MSANLWNILSAQDLAPLERFKAFAGGRTVSVIGIGVSNRPLIDMLLAAGAHVVARDRNPVDHPEELTSRGVKLLTGPDYLSDLHEELIFKTPGMRFDIPELMEARAQGSLVTSEMEVFFALCPTKRTIAVTGSDGKTTTTTLIAKMLQAGGYKVFLGGNIGNPLLPQVGEIGPDDFVVLELSSFQLHTMRQSPHIAVMTNITPNHLDVHKSYQEYIDAKRNIYLYQGPDDTLILNRGNAVTASFAPEAAGRVLDFSYEGSTDNGIMLDHGVLTLVREGVHMPLFPAEDIVIPGHHNVENYMAAILAVSPYVPPEAMADVARTFGGVEHRLQLIRTLDGVRYYNSSIDSSPNRTIAALSVFKQKIILICGGKDKGIPYDDLASPLLEHVKMLLLTGYTAPKIEKALLDECARRGIENPIPIYHYDEYPDLVRAAHDLAQPGDIVLLSPASTSFDRFKNFMERGNTFARLVNEL
ncbi:MAG: UDP-N-acetylmuramoyl-L-alanine--D-glutamate ligase [Firmicutes bacterium]|nr:UDP-N-acetylmuramoyl-L-alanine--D-glutamate ligase [Bacillota bacterium]